MIGAAEQAYNTSRAGQARETLIYVWARDPGTGLTEEIGFWTGAYDTQFVIDGQARSYFGAGAALEIDDIPGGVGLDVRYITAQLGVVAEVEQAIRGYDPRFAPVEIHTAAFDLETGNLIAEPRRVFRGQINETPIQLGGEGGDAVIEINMASSARMLTRTLPLYRSDSEIRRRSAGDRFREHVSTSGLRQVPWAEKQVVGVAGDS